MKMQTIECACPVCGNDVRGNEEYKYVCHNCKLIFKKKELSSPETREKLAIKKKMDELNRKWEEFRKNLKEKTEEKDKTIVEIESIRQETTKDKEEIKEAEIVEDKPEVVKPEMEKMFEEKKKGPDLDAISGLFR